MVLMNLFTEQQWRCRHREQTYGQEKRERMRSLESRMDAYTITYVNREPMEFAL